MKLSDFALSERLSGMYWVRRRSGESLSWTIAAYAHGREPTAWQIVGVACWRTASELGIEEIHSYLGTAPAEAKIAGIMHKPPVVPGAPSPSPAPLRNGFQDLPPIPFREVMPPTPMRRPTRAVIGSNAEPPRQSFQMPLPPLSDRDRSRGADEKYS